jgi:hypothetical protein
MRAPPPARGSAGPLLESSPHPATTALALAGIFVHRAAVDAAAVSALRARTGAAYDALEASGHPGLRGVTRVALPGGESFVPTASSLTLGAVLTAGEQRALCTALLAGPVGESVARALGRSLALCASQAWIRRQYAPPSYPRAHAPHGWHQDGALGFDFLGNSGPPWPPLAMIDMVTCWVPLGRCGALAPGLELVAHPSSALLPPADLAEARVLSQFGPDARVRPELEGGDALLFPGGALHRTHVTPQMRHDRTSIELRFFRADRVPARLLNERFVTL